VEPGLDRFEDVLPNRDLASRRGDAKLEAKVRLNVDADSRAFG
jgi:hypothetical protein